MNNFFKGLFTALAVLGILGKIDHPGAVFARGGKLDPFFGAHRLEKTVGRLKKNAGAVAGVGLTAAGPTVTKIKEDCQSLLNDLVGFFAFNVNDEAYTAAVFFKRRVVKPLF